MSRFTALTVVAMVAMLGLAGLASKHAPAPDQTPSGNAMPPRTTFPQPDEPTDSHALGVLTKPRYQDVPALNRLSIPADAY